MDWTPRDSVPDPWVAVVIYALFMIALVTVFITLRTIL